MRRPSRGAVHMSYSQIFRTIGAYIDNNKLANVRIIETDEGLILQGLALEGDRAGQLDTYQLSVEDIENLIHDAFAQRGKKVG